MRSGGAAALALASACLVLAGCGHHDEQPPTVDWHESRLPTPTGSRAMVRGATYCRGHWVVVGATADARGATRPAVWSSTDGAAWRTLALHPGGNYYAARAILTSVGCSHGRLAVLGAKSGGAHGLPRTATWHQREDGSLVAVRAPFELYGGERAVAVTRLAGGPRGYLIAGTRTSGAAVWTSPTGSAFRLHAGDRGLASSRHARSQALDAAWYDGGWVVVGVVADRTGALRAAVWTAATPGRWTLTSLPGGHEIATAERVVVTSDGPVVTGLDDQGFALWTARDGSWSLAARFGAETPADTGHPAATEASYVTALADAGSGVAVAYSDGENFRLGLGSASGDWHDVPLPDEITVSGGHAVSVAGRGGLLLLLADDGRRGRVWLGEVPH
jgi:hypothetical protein